MRRLLISVILCIGVPLAAAEFDPSLQGVRFFAYQLQNFDTPEGLQALADSHYDLLVIDQTRSIKGSEDYDSAADVASLHATLGSSVNPKKVVCYLDPGQAEDFRWYWQNGWGVGNPSWILATDPDWPGDYPVKFWDPEWKALMKQDLAMIVADGYDGAYLDWMEIYSFGPLVDAAQAEGRDPREELIEFIRELRDYARSLDPDFFFIAQNAAELGVCREWLALFSGIGQEDIWFTWGDGQEGDVPQDPDLTAEFLSNLALWKAAGKVVFDIEYAQESSNVAAAYANGKAQGFITYATLKELDQLAATKPPDYRQYNLTQECCYYAQGPVFSPDGKHLAFTEQDSGIFIVSIDTLEFDFLFWDPGNYGFYTQPGNSWCDSQGGIFFSTSKYGRDQIWSIDPASHEFLQHTDGTYHARVPSLSHDGSWMAFSAQIDAYWRIYKMNLSSREIVAISPEAIDVGGPNWSPAGDKIAFVSEGSASQDIWVMNVDGSNLRNLTQDQAFDWQPSFSPDGRWIVYASDGGSTYYEYIYIISVDDPAQKYRLTPTDYPFREAPSISPDGKTLTFQAGVNNYWDIWTMPIYLPPPSPHERPVSKPE